MILYSETVTPVLFGNEKNYIGFVFVHGNDVNATDYRPPEGNPLAVRCDDGVGLFLCDLRIRSVLVFLGLAIRTIQHQEPNAPDDWNQDNKQEPTAPSTQPA